MKERAVKDNPRGFPWCLLVSLLYPALSQVMLELAQLYLLQGHLDLCEQHCAILLQTEQNHETASVVGSPQHPLPPLPSSLPRVPVTRCRLLPSPITSDASLTHL